MDLSSNGYHQQLVRSRGDSFLETKQFADEKLELDDLDSKSSSSSEGYHFEITEARKHSYNKDKSRNPTDTVTLPAAEVINPVNDQKSMEKGKELYAKL